MNNPIHVTAISGDDLDDLGESLSMLENTIRNHVIRATVEVGGMQVLLHRHGGRLCLLALTDADGIEITPTPKETL